jgi:diadenosine tetraphosphatase ApaH/serine/threonine PP2A family protein phosphatase
VSEHFHGSKGVVDFGDAGRFSVNGKPVGDPRAKRKPADAYQLEHDAFFENIRTGKVRIDAEYAAYSTMMGVMGRMATYTGQAITWDQAFNSKQMLVPEHITWETDAPVKPDADGWYPVAIPGTTEVG